MARNIFTDAAHTAKYGATLLLGKGTISQIEPLVIGAAGGMSGTAFGLVILPLVVGVSTALAQIDHQYRRDRLREEFAEEIAAKRGKKISELGDSDLELVAATNRGLEESLDHSSKERNESIALSILSSLVSMSVVKYLSGVGMPFDALGEGAALMATKVIAGVATYLAVKKPLHWVLDKVQGLLEPTVADRTVSMAQAREQGKAVSQQKVFEVYLKANPDLDQAIEIGYGSSYAKMNRRMRSIVIAEYAPLIGLREITQAINTGQLRPTEMAFAAYGDASGVQPKMEGDKASEPSMGWFQRALQFCVGAKSKPGAVNECVAEAAAPLMDPATPLEIVEEENPLQKSFADKVGRKSPVAIERAKKSDSYVERVAQQSSVPPVLGA